MPTARRRNCCRRSSASSVRTTPHDARCAQATRAGKESARIDVSVFHRPEEALRLCRSHTSLAEARSLWSTNAEDRNNPPLPHGMEAWVRSDDGVCSRSSSRCHTGASSRIRSMPATGQPLLRYDTPRRTRGIQRGRGHACTYCQSSRAAVEGWQINGTGICAACFLGDDVC